MYKKEFDIRWADLDANRHVANSSFVDYLSETRMSYMREKGFAQQQFEDIDIGPVIFAEELYYIKEIKHDETITISLELLANSPDFKYIKLAHCIFNEAGKLCIYSETFFGWFKLNERKLIPPPSELQAIYASLTKADHYERLGDQVSLKNPKIPFGKTI